MRIAIATDHAGLPLKRLVADWLDEHGYDVVDFGVNTPDRVDYPDLIAERIGGYGNWTRRAASNTITGIGLRNDTLEAAARASAGRIGQVEFDPGQTSCAMPDPIEYLEKTKAHRAKQAQKRAARSARGR